MDGGVVSFGQLYTVYIYSDFDHNPSLENRGNFLDISKAFDKVCHDGLLYKLESFGISGDLLKFLDSYLNNRQ